MSNHGVTQEGKRGDIHNIHIQTAERKDLNDGLWRFLILSTLHGR